MESLWWIKLHANRKMDVCIMPCHRRDNSRIETVGMACVFAFVESACVCMRESVTSKTCQNDESKTIDNKHISHFHREMCLSSSGIMICSNPFECVELESIWISFFLFVLLLIAISKSEQYQINTTRWTPAVYSFHLFLWRLRVFCALESVSVWIVCHYAYGLGLLHNIVIFNAFAYANYFMLWRWCTRRYCVCVCAVCVASTSTLLSAYH